MKILITGIHGFVGSNLVAYLKGRHIIYGLGTHNTKQDGVNAVYSWDDLTHGNLPEVDAIIHLAGKAHDTKNKSKAEIYFEVNTGLTQKIFDYFLQSAARKFIFFSSIKAAADVVPGDILTEDVVPQPKGPYGESKIAAENYIQKRLQEVSVSNGKEVYIFRPCMIHGPGNKGNLNLLYGVVKKGIPWPLGAFENKRTFVSIDNLCFIVSNFLMKSIPSGVYHIADDEAISTNELIEIICQAMGKKAKIWHINKGFMEGVAKIGTCLRLPLNSERLSKLTENYVASNEKVKNALGIKKMPVTAKDGLFKTIRSFQK